MLSCGLGARDESVLHCSALNTLGMSPSVRDNTQRPYIVRCAPQVFLPMGSFYTPLLLQRARIGWPAVVPRTEPTFQCEFNKALQVFRRMKIGRNDYDSMKEDGRKNWDKNGDECRHHCTPFVPRPRIQSSPTVHALCCAVLWMMHRRWEGVYVLFLE